MIDIPAEIFAKVSDFLEYQFIMGVEACQETSLWRFVEAKKYWATRTLKVHDNHRLHNVLQSSFCKAALRLDLGALDIDDDDLAFVSNHFRQIEWIDISNCSQISDVGIESLLTWHGRHIKTLRMDRLYALTNISADSIAKHCPHLRTLSMEGTMISTSGLRRISEGCSQLHRLSITRCHLIDLDQLPSIANSLQRLNRLDASNLDFMQPHQLTAVVQTCTKLRRLGVKGCAELTLKSLRDLQTINPHLTIDHNARLEDHSICSIRRYLLSMIESC